MIGKIISHYKILEKLGEGGMGVVYKAEDTKLKRIVALKFLPHHLSVTNELNARLLNEAQMTAKLNHPHICTIYDIEEADDEKFIVMEFVDGVTLRKKIKENPLKVDESVNYAIQIGEALEEAHSQGIIHRDIKPDNVMINSKNQIKVMDFGIAKLKEGLGVTRTMSTSGTVSYMAPEQLSNSKIDGRVDIFSFGILFYEMLSSRLPFRGEHHAAMMYSIMNEEPEPINKYLSEVPSEMLHALNRALEKDPEDRYQNVHDMVIDLRRLKKQTGGITHHTTTHEHFEQITEPTPSPFGFLRNKSKKQLSIILGIVLLSVGAGSIILFLPRDPQLNPDMKFRTLQLSFSQISYPGISSDGNWIAFQGADVNGKWDVYYMNVAVGDPRRVTFDSSTNPYGNSADISPDGGIIVYDRYDAKRRWYDAYVVPSIGGRSKKIAENCQSPNWRCDGGRIGFIDGTSEYFSIWSVKPNGSDRRMEIIDSISISGRIDFDWSPDGKSVVWLRSFPDGYQEIMRCDLETGNETQLTHDKKNIDEVCWTSNDQIIFSSNKSGNTNLWMIPASGGQSIQITKGIGPDLGMSISTDGKKLLYLQSQAVGHLWRGATDGRATRQLTTDERSINWPSFSPDGRQIVFSMSDNDPLKSTSHIYMCDRDGNNRRQITTGDELAEWPTWAPNGKWIAYYAMKSGQPSDSAMIYIVDQADPGIPRPIARGLFSKWIDTTTLMITNPFRGTGSIVTLDGKSTSITYKDSVNLWPILDGKNVLLFDIHIGKAGWYVAAAKNNQVIEGTKPKKLVTFRHPPNLSPDKKFLYYAVESEILRRISLPEGKDERIPGTFPGLSFLFSISSDGKEIVYNDSRLNAKLVIIENLFK
jgi:eukaryotic-like serine/threonine-protein kinase